MNTIKVLQELAALKQNEKKSAAQLHRLQEQKLRAMLTHAYEHSRYYKNAFEAAGLTAETVRTAPLSAFPTLDKATLLERFDDLITVSDVTQEELRRFDAEETADRKPYKGKFHVVHSSGSTGTPGYFLYDSYPIYQCRLNTTDESEYNYFLCSKVLRITSINSATDLDGFFV